PAISFGAHLYLQYSPAYDLRTTTVPRGATTDYTPTSGSTILMGVGLYGRVYLGSALGLRRIDPWIGVGLDFSSTAWVATSVHTRTGTTDPMTGVRTISSEADTTISNTVSAVSVPLSAGFDVNLSPELSIGLIGQVSLWVPYGRCGNAHCSASVSCTSQSYDVLPMFFLGAQARFLSPI
ncbi:MAG: hypothetical protein WCJ30_20470, partial [Deltaproteobacteria bacterium]